jgi:hypothetical protein
MVRGGPLEERTLSRDLKEVGEQKQFWRDVVSCGEQ